MPSYLDEPFALELAQLEEARTLLRTLAARPGPLPPYWRSRLARIALTLTSLRRDLARHARHTALEGIETTRHYPENEIALEAQACWCPGRD